MDCNLVAIPAFQPPRRLLKVIGTFIPSMLYLILLVPFQCLVFKGLYRSASRCKARTEHYYVVIRGCVAPGICNNESAEALQDTCIRGAYIEYTWRRMLFGRIVNPIGIPDHLPALLIFPEEIESSDKHFEDSSWRYHATHASR